MANPLKQYPVERIEGKRTCSGQVQYFIKWKGYPRSENTWEPVNHLHCPILIAKFEKNLKSKKDAKKRSSSARLCVQKTRLRRVKKSRKTKGVARGLEPSKILNATNSGGTLLFQMKWKGSAKTEFVPAKVTNVKWPQLVIKFYEKITTFVN